MMPPTDKNHGCPVVPTDLLSNLPENVIDAIVIHLPLRDAVRTSILSKKWRYNWCRLPELTLDQALWETTDNVISPTARFTNIFYHLLTLHVGPILKFTLSVADLGNCPKIDNLICFLSRNGIQHLVLQFPKRSLYKLPSSFFTCFQMRHLSLHNCSINPPPVFKGFDNLVSLELCGVTIHSPLLESLISHSPLLKQLVLQSSVFYHVQIKAPKLRSFNFKGRIRFISVRNAPLLAKLTIVDGGYSEKAGIRDTTKFIQSFHALEHLHLDYSSVRFLAGEASEKLPTALNCLKRLHLGITLDELAVVSFALCLIRSSPYLQDIEIQVYKRFNPATSDAMNEIPALKSLEVEGFSDVTLNHLRAVKLESITGTKPEMQLIKLLLAKSPMLIGMLIEHGQGNKSLEARLELVTELTKFQRASPKAEVVYKGS
ncbi:F-box/FBD/LRR-repeat protein At1g13570-like [Lycium barbarum]|uniref:F-box/FBD/LRR-repeat protein At1g13570-like n=1 Tax=Lycium barbarum TaxID=112863 RepID=UPI00293EE6FB|nr:F-box/FBD/LRR-repeat protein At1g13570-like [Lycium barbarum]XP_060195528.1 F-box/FBD/LRR-repeat protein At1g13570-like [Lycium barbarum]